MASAQRSWRFANRMSRKCAIIFFLGISLLLGCSQNSSQLVTVTRTMDISSEAANITITHTQPVPTNTLAQTPDPVSTKYIQKTKIFTPIAETDTPSGTPFVFIDTQSIYPFFPFVGLPIPAGYQQEVDRSYPFGSILAGETIAHEGVEFYNSDGTPVLAAQDGKVIFSGDDIDIQWGRLKNYYGNLIVLEHKDERTGTTFFTLYAHLSERLVEKDDFVHIGQQIGKVGASGAALGSHLHFEIRMFEPYLENAVNPELFLELIEKENSGMLAGKIVGPDGKLVLNNPITIQPIIDGKIDSIENVRFISTYSADLPDRTCCRENFVFGNIPVGEYRVTTYIDGVFYEEQVKIDPDSVTYVVFGS
jgi:hypothetical protein